MATDGKNNIVKSSWMSLHSRVLMSVMFLCWVMVATFIVFQYQREKELKTLLLDTGLQAYNERIVEGMHRGESLDSIVTHISRPAENMLVSITAPNGKIIYNNSIIADSLDTAPYYSAQTVDNGYIIKSTVPYTHSLKELLETDSTLLWILGAMTILMSGAGFIAARKISITISRLNRFAAKAERGEPIFSDEAFPDDELGSIAGHIVRLYMQRDNRHREALLQEQEKIRIKKQLTNNINHELKTPVAAILVCIELLHDHPELAPETKAEFIERILIDARRLDSLLKDVSTITRMDDGSHAILKEPVDIKQVIEGVVAATQLPAGMHIDVNIARQTVNGNREMLESVFRNLTDNAVAYSGCNEIIIKSDGKGKFVFRDNGCGVPEEHLPHIFERFYRIDGGRSRRSGGTGLGLAIVRNALRLHDGTIEASNDGGLRFDFTLK